MPEDFIDRLRAAVQDLERTIKDQSFNKGIRLAATATIEQTRSDALAALQRLDPIMVNILREDPPTRGLGKRAACRAISRLEARRGEH